MAESVYLICGLLSIACAVMLLRGYRQNPSHLLLWSSVAFALLALNNIILVADLIIFPAWDFGGILWRNMAGALGGSLLLFGLIWEIS